MATLKQRRDAAIGTAVKGEGGKHSMTIADGRQFWEQLVKINGDSQIADAEVTPEIQSLLVFDTVAYIKKATKVKKPKAGTVGVRAKSKHSKTKSSTGKKA